MRKRKRLGFLGSLFLAAGIAEGDGGAHLKTYHPTGIQSSSNWFHNEAWLDFNMVQSRHMILNRTYDLIKTDWDRTPPKPVVEGESVYEGIQDELVYSDGNAKRIQPEDVIRQARACPDERQDSRQADRESSSRLVVRPAERHLGANRRFPEDRTG